MAKPLRFIEIKTKSDVEKVLKLNNFLQGRGFDKIRNEFLGSLKMKNGKVAHMYYAAVKGVLSESDFYLLLALLGKSAHQFIIEKDRRCTAFNQCEVNHPGYSCDADVCNG